MAKTFLTKKNNAKSTITDNPLLIGATTLNVQTGEGVNFPTAPFHATLYTTDPAAGEIVKVTAKATDAFTIERAKEDTSAAEWAQNTKLELFMTAQLLDDFQTRTGIVVATDGSGDYNCDGTSDETEINEAISNLPAGGGIVYLKAGTYTIDGEINFAKSNVELRGEGDSTIITQPNSTELNQLIAIGNGGSNSYSNIKIRDIYVDGNGANQTTGYANSIVVYGSASYRHTNIEISGCTITGSRTDSLKLLESEYCRVVNNHFKDITGGTAILDNHEQNIIANNTFNNCYYAFYGTTTNYTTITGNNINGGTYGIFLTSGRRTTISGNSISLATTGIQISGCQRVNVTGNMIYSGSNGIIVGNSTSVTQSCTISGNSVSYQTYRSIWLYGGTGGCQQIAVTGNSIVYPGQHGIRLYGAQRCVVTGNTIDGCGRTTDNSYPSILLHTGTSNATHNVISGNSIVAQQTNKANYHIQEGSSSDDYNLITGNILQGAVTANTSILGANSVAANNISV